MVSFNLGFFMEVKKEMRVCHSHVRSSGATGRALLGAVTFLMIAGIGVAFPFPSFAADTGLDKTNTKKDETLKKDPVVDYEKLSGEISAEKAVLVEGSNCIGVKLTNHGKIIDALVKASSPIARQAVLIDQKMHRDVQKIELLPGIPNTLSPGMACIILRDYGATPKAGDRFLLNLEFLYAKPVAVEVMVEAAPEAKNPEVKPQAQPADKPVEPAAEASDKAGER